MRTKNNLNGFINLYKPVGISSHQAVGALKKILQPKKIGHGGTLDLLADGVLPIALGEATKTLQFMLESDKEYEFELTWGYETDSFDLEGNVTNENPKIPTELEIKEAIKNFTGAIEQIPSAFSALKINGKSAYELARLGEEVDMTCKKRTVTINSFELLKHEDGKSFFRASVSKGTYIRCLGIDLARSIDSCATITKLTRTKTKKFDINQSISIEKLDELAKDSHNMQDLLLDVNMVLDDIPVFIASKSQETYLKNGQIKFELQDIGLHRICSEGQTLLSIVNNTVDGIKIIRSFNL